MRALLVAALTVGCGSDPGSTVDAPPSPTDVTSTDDAPLLDAPPDAFIPPAGPWRVVVAGTNPCAIHTDGRIKCWGSMLGYEVNELHGDEPNEMGTNLPAINLGEGLTAKDVVVGSGHACALFTNGRIKCWGSNQYGQLGLDDTDERGRHAGDMGNNLPFVDLGTGRTVKAISASDFNTCAILDNDRLKCWGHNAAGACGLGDSNRRGDNPGEMGDALPYVDLGTGRTVKKIFVGTIRACALLDNDALKCWGNNFSGVMGQGQLTTHVGTSPSHMGDNLRPIDLGPNLVATHVTHQGESICATLTTGAVKCWGRGTEAELANGIDENLGDEPNEMGAALPFANLGTNPTSLAGGASHGCASFADGSVACWGSNYRGTLGLGLANNDQIGDTAAELGANLPRVPLAGPVATLHGGQSIFTCATLVSGHIQCWGWNALGALGLGDDNDRGDDIAEMGTALPYLDLGP